MAHAALFSLYLPLLIISSAAPGTSKSQCWGANRQAGGGGTGSPGGLCTCAGGSTHGTGLATWALGRAHGGRLPVQHGQGDGLIKRAGVGGVGAWTLVLNESLASRP